MRFTLLVVTLTLMGIPAWPGPAPQLPSPGRADIAIMSARHVAHVSTEPLLLAVQLFNGAARQIATDNIMNEDHAADVQASERFRSLPGTTRARLLEPFAPVPVPAVRLGAPGRALSEFVRFTVQNGDGAAVALRVRPLASASGHRDAVRLDEHRSVVLAYGADASAVAALPSGVYAIRAHVDTTSGRDMWIGQTVSRPILVTLEARAASETPQARRARLVRAGEFHLADEQFGRAEALAREIIAAEERSVDGWVLLGDALDGLGRLQEALDTFVRALQLANADAPELSDPPAYIHERIVEIQAALGRG